MSMDIREKQMQYAAIFGKPVLFTNGSVSRDTVPVGWYCYDLRGTEKQPYVASVLTDTVSIYRVGAIISPVALKRPDTAERRINGTFFLHDEQMNLTEFCKVCGLEYPQDTRKFVLRPALPNETELFFSRMDAEQDRELACVGHLQLDFGYHGKELWSIWNQHNSDELNVPAFKAELDAVVNELRVQGPLKNLDIMADYCDAHPEGVLEAGYGGSTGFITESENYRYCLRCMPWQDGYNGYLYIYDKNQQALNMAQKQSELTEARRQMPRDCVDPGKAQQYQWFVIGHFAQDGETLYKADSLTGAIDRFNGLRDEDKRLGVTKDEIATINLVITEGGETRIDEGSLDDPHFVRDDTISEAVTRLQLSIAGLKAPQQNMTMGGM